MVTYELNDQELEEIIRQAYFTGLSESKVVSIDDKQLVKSRVERIKNSIDMQIIDSGLQPYAYIKN